MNELNATHDPGLQSWVESANAEDNDFPIQNLPFGVFRREGTTEPFRAGVAIGDHILDIAAAHGNGAFAGEAARGANACAGPSLSTFMALGPDAWSALRSAISKALLRGAQGAERLRSCLIPTSGAEFSVPAQIGDYTDFYTSIYHATTVGRQFRPDNPLLPNYKWVPIGYHGRSSTIAVSGQSFHRPMGQILPSKAERPVFGPTQRLDYEAEVGVFIGVGNAGGEPIRLADAERHVFGLTLLNDWSARDIQAWEYQPLGPFLSKNFATTISPWIVTLEALAPYRAEWVRPADDPQPLPYLEHGVARKAAAIDIQMEVFIETESMRNASFAPTKLSSTSFRHSYWTIGQMVTHHTVNGCELRSGDLLGSGTESGPTANEAGSLLELSSNGKKPIDLGNGEKRTFLEDNDIVIMRGWCKKPETARVGFGECRGLVLPPRAP